MRSSVALTVPVVEERTDVGMGATILTDQTDFDEHAEHPERECSGIAWRAS